MPLLSARLDFLEKNADQPEEWWTAAVEEPAAGDEDMQVVQGDVEAKVSFAFSSLERRD